MTTPAPAKARESELQYLKEKRDNLYTEAVCNQVEIDITTERIWEILNERD